MITRKNQNSLSTNEWNDFIDSVNKTHGMNIPAPRYRDFVKVHVDSMSSIGMSWGVHTMPNMGMHGRNFLTWHRWFLVQFERRLQQVHPNVSIPYWDAIADRAIPNQLTNSALLLAWGVLRGVFDASQIATVEDLDAVNQTSTFVTFQRILEGAIHGGVHNAIGGDMRDKSSPTDPLFWLHHANIDRIWANWQRSHPNEAPSNLSEKLKPSPIFKIKVQEAQDISRIGYLYQ